MADTATTPIRTLAEFLAWEERQELRHEFVNGRIVAMAGGTKAHNRIATNTFKALDRLLEGKLCQPFIADIKVLIEAHGNSRYPDVVVDCTPFAANDISATKPTVVFEVLSKSTAWIDQGEKMDDYAAVPSLQAVVLIAQDKRRIELWVRAGDRLMPAQVGEADVALACLDTSLGFDVIYDGITFEDIEKPASPSS